jgi:hypothetical protein
MVVGVHSLCYAYVLILEMTVMQIGVATSAGSLAVAIVSGEIIVCRLPSLVRLKNTDVDQSLIWPQLIAVAVLLGFSIGNLAMYVRASSGIVIELDSCESCSRACLPIHMWQGDIIPISCQKSLLLCTQ